MNPALPIKQRLAEPENVAVVLQLLSAQPAPTRLHQPVKAAYRVPQQIEQIHGLRLIEVATAEHLLIWNELMIREHRLRDARLVGRQFRCLIGSDHGWLGGIGFGGAALYLEDRDEWMGWNAAQRTAHLSRVINMTRFLVRPGVRCPNLASHVLGLCARRIAGDLERRCKLRPWLLESFVDLTAYLGTWYKEANWRKAGQTKGRGRNGPRDAGLSRKDIYWHPLMGGLDARCGVECFAAEALESHHGLDGAGWAEQEFGTCALGDKRLTRRLVKIVGDEAAHPGGPHAQAAGGDPAQLKAFYRFVNNENPEMNVTGLLQTHRTQSLRRMKARDTVLVVQDTTDLNFTSYTHCAGLGETNANQTGAKADLLVRAKWDRQLEGTDATLFAELAAAPLAKSVKIAVPRQREHVGKPSAPGRPPLAARAAEVQLRYKEVTLCAYQTPTTRDLPPVRLWAILLEEKHPPAGATAVRWVLLTTMQVASAKQALKCVRWYCRRWRIEEWHRVMKSGCKILEHQNHEPGVLLRAIALDAVIAWRIMLLTLLGRTVPGLPADLLFDPCECEVLALLRSKKTLPE